MNNIDESDLKIKKNKKTIGDIIFGGISLFLVSILFFFNIQNEVCLSRKFVFPQAYANRVILTVMGITLLVISAFLIWVFAFKGKDKLKELAAKAKKNDSSNAPSGDNA